MTLMASSPIVILVAGWIFNHASALLAPRSNAFSKLQSGETERLPALHDTMADYSQNVMNTYGRYPMTIQRGSGCKLYDMDGKEYLDFASGIATCCLGHSHPALKKAVSEQMERVHHCSNLYFIPEQAALAKWLVDNSCADKVRTFSYSLVNYESMVEDFVQI
jgi:4-aminobutyrate aminotransferase-like enzyme